MPNRQVAEWYVVCWYCKNTVNAENRVNAPTAELASFLTRKTTRNWKKRESNHEPIAQIRLVLL